MYVVDSSDRERVSESRAELEGILSEPAMYGVPVVIVANKQDLPNALSPAQLIDKLQLRQQGHALSWHVQGTCATNGEGILEAMQAMAKMVKEAGRKWASIGSNDGQVVRWKFWGYIMCVRARIYYYQRVLYR